MTRPKCCTHAFLIAAIATLFVWPSGARAQDLQAEHTARSPSPSARRDTVRLAMSVSGAISVGSYQAGVNWGILRFLQLARVDTGFQREARNRQLPAFELRAITGASAGNVNTLLWAVEWCTMPDSVRGEILKADPWSSLFWKTWVGIGLEAMLPEKYEARNMDRAAFNRPTVRRITDPPIFERLQSQRFIKGCELPVGITLTRTQPDIIEHDGLEIETQRFATLFRAKVVTDEELEQDGDGLHFVHLATRPNAQPHLGKLVRLVPPTGRIGTEQVLSAVQASAAFPVALAPVQLDAWYPGADTTGREARSLFIDGGVFDNNPINLALGLYRDGGATSPARLVYINPFRYRGELARVRRRGPATSPAIGGFAAFGEFVSGAIATARQYELQLLARERHARTSMSRGFSAWLDTLGRELRTVRPADTLPETGLPQILNAIAAHPSRDSASLHDRLSFSSRSYPIFGERLGGFAGFLGRPFREFDFHVGTYDGLTFTAREFVCDGLAAQAEQACIRRVMARMIRDERMVPAPARRLLATLYDREHHPDRALPGRRGLVDSVRVPTNDEDLTLDRMLMALYRAAGTHLDPAPETSCTERVNPMHRWMCRDGLSAMLSQLAGDVDPDSAYARAGTTRHILGMWAGACTSTDPGACLATKDFLSLVFEEEWFAPRLLERILTRLEDVERGLKRIGQPNHALAVTAMNGMYHTTHLRSRSRFETSPSKARRANPFLHLVPYSVGGPVGRSGWEVRYRPTFNAADRWPVTFPLAWMDDAERKLARGSRNAVSAGLGLGRRAPIPSIVLLVPEAGLEMHGVFPLTKRSPEAHDAWTATELYATFFGGYLRGSLRMDSKFPYQDPHNVSVNVAFADLGGLAYWVYRSTFKK